MFGHSMSITLINALFHLFNSGTFLNIVYLGGPTSGFAKTTPAQNVTIENIGGTVTLSTAQRCVLYYFVQEIKSNHVLQSGIF